jgi:hypothetical protein
MVPGIISRESRVIWKLPPYTAVAKAPTFTYLYSSLTCPRDTFSTFGYSATIPLSCSTIACSCAQDTVKICSDRATQRENKDDYLQSIGRAISHRCNLPMGQPVVCRDVCAVDKAMRVQNLAQAGSPRLSISIESLLIKRPSCRTTQLAQQFWAGLDSAAIKAHVARYCGDVSSMQAREGRMLHIRHLRNRRRPKCRIEARKTPRLITHEEVTGGKMQGLAHACGCSYL